MKFSEFRQYQPKTDQNVFVFVCEDDFLVEESRRMGPHSSAATGFSRSFTPRNSKKSQSASLTDDALTPSLFSQSRRSYGDQRGKADEATDRGSDRAPDGRELFAQDHSRLQQPARSAEAWTKTFPVVEIDPLKPAEVARWLVDRYGVSAEIARYMVENVGTELYPLHNEMEKLRTYVGEGRPIEIRDVDASSCVSEQFGPFELDDAILARDYRKAVHVLGAMLEEGWSR